MGQVTKFFYYAYDLASATYVYDRYLPEEHGTYGIETSGSSTTVTATSGTPFAQVGVGDILILKTANGETTTIRKVTAKASPTSITIDSAINLTSTCTSWSFMPYVSGSASTGQGHSARGYTNKSINISLPTIGAPAIDISIQGKTPGGLGGWVDIVPDGSIQLTATGSQSVQIIEPWMAIRVGVKAATFTGTDALTISLTGEEGRW